MAVFEKADGRLLGTQGATGFAAWRATAATVLRSELSTAANSCKELT